MKPVLLSLLLLAALHVQRPAPVSAEEHPNQFLSVLQGAAQGQPDMLYRLAMWKFWALPQHRDVPGALRLFCLAAVQNHAAAQTHLGLMYWMGSGLPRDPLQAYLWFHLAAQQGGEVAAEHRDRVGRDYLDPERIRLARSLAEVWHRAPTCPVQLS
jgi:TPR repeat protein